MQFLLLPRPLPSPSRCAFLNPAGTSSSTLGNWPVCFTDMEAILRVRNGHSWISRIQTNGQGRRLESSGGGTLGTVASLTERPPRLSLVVSRDLVANGFHDGAVRVLGHWGMELHPMGCG